MAFEGIPVITTGIRGISLASPILPVNRPGQINTRPLVGAIIVVESAGGGPEIARVAADATGLFQIALPPGDYLLVPLPPVPSPFPPHALSMNVQVIQGHMSAVTIVYDTGIR